MHARLANWLIVVELGAVMAAVGCGRPTPSPVAGQQASAAAEGSSATAEGSKDAGRSNASAAAPGSKPPVTARARPVIRDESVAPAAFAAPLPPPAPSEQQLAAEALSRIGPPAVPMLVQALHSPDLETRRRALEVLLRMGPDAKEAVPDLVALLNDEDEEIRKGATAALGRIGPDAAQAVPALMRSMLHGEAEPLPPP